MTEPAVTFDNHRGVVPMLGVFAGLATIELLVVHLMAATHWPRLAWPLTALNLASVVWLVQWITSWKRLPHRLCDGVLRLNMGSMRHIDLRLAEIAAIRAVSDGAEIKARTTRNLVPVAWPNRIIDLKSALPGRKQVRRIAIRLDDPLEFDRALRDQGISVPC
ncbi:hypothetical protein [Novosphingobium sp.]|uniref:hypothetical protein n=1 Tax=Novosphingobium sp. TaxID=1874826 RepID=UPI0025EDBBFF|nr:hypothetical protein [Novosphingobium sp.]